MNSANELWCESQSIDISGKVICLAHFAEGRVLACPYKDIFERLRAVYPCSDFRENTDRYLLGRI